jgi:Ala-tRNA(Pro) deacylase
MISAMLSPTAATSVCERYNNRLDFMTPPDEMLPNLGATFPVAGNANIIMRSGIAAEMGRCQADKIAGRLDIRARKWFAGSLGGLFMIDLYRYLDERRIAYRRCDHPPVYTLAEAKKRVPRLPAARVKNLFLRDNKGRRHFLVVVPAGKRVDMKQLNPAIGSSRLSFGSAGRLEKFLGVKPGAVSILAIVNDRNHAVEVVVDLELWEQAAFQFHPLVNTSTLVISRDDLKRFLTSTGHPVQSLRVPGTQPSDVF